MKRRGQMVYTFEDRKEWLEGRQAFIDGIDEDGCPYDQSRDWHRWCDWVCGHGEAKREAWERENDNSENVSV